MMKMNHATYAVKRQIVSMRVVFLGEEEIDCICDSCLASGALIDMDICANDIDFETVEEAITDEDEFDRLTNEIIYQSPKLPTWQDCYSPFADGDFATFIKIASKLDFGNNFETFKASLVEDSSHAKDLWANMPDHKITSLATGNYDQSVYLFRSCKGKLISLWDCN